MALAIKLSSFISGGFTGDLMRWILKEDVSGATVDTHEELGPHGTVYNFSFSSNIRDIIYRIELYDVPPGAMVGTLIKSHVVSVTTNTLVLTADIEIIVGRGTAVDPAAGDAVIPNIPALVGQTWRVVQRSIGPLLQTREAEVVCDNVNGNFALTGGNTFNDSDIFILEVNPMLVVNPAGTQGAGMYKGVEVITDERAIVSADIGKLLIIDGAVKVMTFQFPNKATLPDRTPLFFENLATSNDNVNVVLRANNGGDVFRYNGTSDQRFILSRGDGCQIIKVDNDLFAFSNSYDIKRRGEIEYVLNLGLNRIVADGTEYEQADYPGLVQAIQKLGAGQVLTTFAAWNLNVTIGSFTYFYNQGFYALYGTKIRVPNLLGNTQKALLNIGGADATRYTNLPGGFQKEQVGEIDTTVKIKHGYGYTGAPNSVISGNGANNPQDMDVSFKVNTGKKNISDNNGYIPAIII